MPWYIVTGRIPFDEEDSLLIVNAKDWDEACSKFKQQVLLDPNYDDVTEFEDPKVFINYVVECGEQEPRIRLASV